MQHAPAIGDQVELAATLDPSSPEVRTVSRERLFSTPSFRSLYSRRTVTVRQFHAPTPVSQPPSPDRSGSIMSGHCSCKGSLGPPFYTSELERLRSGTLAPPLFRRLWHGW